jgi:hypothetical protein
LLVFLPVFLAGQALAWLTYAVTGWFQPWSWFKIGSAEALTGSRVPFEATASARNLAFGPAGISVVGRLVVATGALTIAVLVLSYRAGREQARGLEQRPRAAALAGAAVGLGFAIPSVVSALPVTLSLPRFGIDQLRPVWWQAFLLPFVVGCAAAAAGGLARTREHLGSTRYAWEVAAARGGAVAFWWGLVGSFLGVLLAAAIAPGPVGAYARFADRTGGSGAALVVVHATLLPNQSALVLGAAMGAPTELTVGDQEVLRVSRDGVQASGATGPFIAAIVGSADQRLATFPPWFVAFLLVPAVGAILGGRAARRERAAVGFAEQLLVGSAAGIVFAACCALAVWAASVTLPNLGGGLDGLGAGAIRLGASPARTGLLALAWGVVGCALGAVIPWPDRLSAGPTTPR